MIILFGEIAFSQSMLVEMFQITGKKSSISVLCLLFANLSFLNNQKKVYSILIIHQNGKNILKFAHHALRF